MIINEYLFTKYLLKQQEIYKYCKINKLMQIKGIYLYLLN